MAARRRHDHRVRGRPASPGIQRGMPNRLLHLYIRSVTASARLTLRLTGQALKLAGSALGAVRPSPAHEAPEPSRQPSPPPRREPRAEPPASAPPPAAQAPPVQYDTEPMTPLDSHDESVKTIDDEPELVGEFSEPGAEDGAGANLVIDEPWPGYGEMTAEDVIGRLAEAGQAEVALVELYERAHKQRSTVLSAAERRLQAERA